MKAALREDLRTCTLCHETGTGRIVVTGRAEAVTICQGCAGALTGVLGRLQLKIDRQARLAQTTKTRPSNP